MKFLDFNQIKDLRIQADELFNWTVQVWEKQDEFILPPKLHTWQGESGRYMTMPCIMPNEDIAGVKFICRNVDDVEGLPKRNSNIMLQRISQHGLYAVLDGTWITTMRTGACAYYNATKFSRSDYKTLSIYGLGLAARAFMYFWYNLNKHSVTVKLLPYKDQVEQFINKYPETKYIKYKIVNNLEELFDSDIIVSCVSFAHDVLCNDTNVYNQGCTIVPVHTSGFQNCDLVFDKIFVDDIGHVKEYKYYEQFKSRMTRITDVQNFIRPGRETNNQRVLVYNGGLAIFDIYWAIKILEKYNNEILDIPMSYPVERFWI
jgi:ornithine cyclodeaminase/alanine dehydrogenase-like protein (mu-crystallin family)